MLTTDTLEQIAGQRFNATAEANAASILGGLRIRAEAAGLNRWHRLAHYVAHLAHESGRFRYDREIWGPTAAQRGYEGRADLGNTQPGDGARFKGRTGGQITGRANYRAFSAWARSIDPGAPDFVTDPEAINLDPWEGLGPVWFWEINGLVRYADRNDIEGLTKRWNGGLNGYADRIALYTRAALVFLGYPADAVRRFQGDAGLVVDGDPGPMTRRALHDRLVGLMVAPTDPPPADPVDPHLDLLARLRALHAAMGEELGKA